MAPTPCATQPSTASDQAQPCMSPTALVSRMRSLYSACWKTCLVEKAQARCLVHWRTVPQEAGRAAPRQAPRLLRQRRGASIASAAARPLSRGGRAGWDRFEPLMAPTTASCTPW
eukprot:scaffold56739_cov66-Phaeocystis_antarctica.AAC.6